MRTRVVLTALVALLTVAQTAMAGKQEKIRVRVSAPVDSAGFTVADGGITDSVKDLEKKLRGMKEFAVVSPGEKVDLEIVVTRRFETSESLGYAGSFTADESGARGGYGERHAYYFVVEADLRAGGYNKGFRGWASRGDMDRSME